MARLHPVLGSCPHCGGTGRVPLQHGLWSFPLRVGDQTLTCGTCLGAGQTWEEQAAQIRGMLANGGGVRE